ncbi:Bud-site selection protein [Rhodocollybia butyracea]|uniref:Bud-site selection protein n=1 Tax=Rhodocollybia butyracea TaxID=206335 RepID=A0A9P5Q974_9AGAR|nr:Bud-site selection protein [Rhodocollybia butyracea]
MKEDHQKKGVKRKRFEPLKEHHDLKEVRRAAKKAKTFETQKLVKKLKGLRLKDESDPSIAECEFQLQELKLINHEAIANTALRTKLTKDKVLSDNESMQAALSKELTANLLEPASGGTVAAKVQSRLLSSKILASEVAVAVEDLRAVIHPTTDHSQDGDISSALDESLPERPKKLKKMERIMEDEDVEMSVGEDDEEVAQVGDDEEMDADGWESGTVGDDEKEPDNGWESGSNAGESNGYMDEDLPSDSQAETKKSFVKVSPIAGPSKSSSKVVAGQSTFLPTLSTGFIRGSDSDWSDSDDKVADIAEKKNRRGQRARRAIWEKKYGRNANHKKKEAASNTTAEAERGRKRWSSSNVSSDRPLNKGGAGRRDVEASILPRQQDSGWEQRGKAASANRDSKPLHPSWEAKKKLSERQSAAIVPPTGRKIKFS